MGKYMRKARISGEVAVVDVPDQPPLAGVRTRARTLAIQRRQPLPEPDCYLQLRSRRLEKTQLTPPSKGPTKGGASAEAQEEEDGVGVSFGDNLVDLESRERNARETTPCSSIRNSEAIRTPGSTNRQPPVRRMTNGCKSTPSPGDVEEFFAGAEQLQQRQFMEKYNFDPVNDCPLPGRYEWVKLDSS